jgi:hypothetical protein
MTLSDEQLRVLKNVLTDRVFQNLIGGEEWDLSEADEMILWDMIHAAEKENEKERGV